MVNSEPNDLHGATARGALHQQSIAFRDSSGKISFLGQMASSQQINLRHLAISADGDLMFTSEMRWVREKKQLRSTECGPVTRKEQLLLVPLLLTMDGAHSFNPIRTRNVASLGTGILSPHFSLPTS